MAHLISDDIQVDGDADDPLRARQQLRVRNDRRVEEHQKEGGDGDGRCRQGARGEGSPDAAEDQVCPT